MASVVYFIKSGKTIKIGVTTNLKNRIKTLSTASSTKLELLKTIPGNIKTEAAIHSMFAEHRLNGEWFHAHQDILDFIRYGNVNDLFDTPILARLTFDPDEDRWCMTFDTSFDEFDAFDKMDALQSAFDDIKAKISSVEDDANKWLVSKGAKS